MSYNTLASGAALLESAAASSAGCVIFTTSGTTSAPKFVLHDQRTVIAHAINVARGFGLDSTSAMLLAPPLCGVYGFCSAMAALAAGGPLGRGDRVGPGVVGPTLPTPTADALGLGESVVLLATLTRARGDTATGLPIVWSASDTSVVTVDTTGYATAVGIGTADVRAVIGARSASATITVKATMQPIITTSPWAKLMSWMMP